MMYKSLVFPSVLRGIWCCVRITSAVWAVAWSIQSAPAADIQWNGGSNDIWQNVNNWDPFGAPISVHRVPGDTDTATLSTPAGDTVILQGDTAPINGLLVTNGIDIRTSGFRLQVDDAGSGTTTIAGSGTRILVVSRILDGLAFHTDGLFISGGGLLEVAGGGEAQVDGMTTLLSQGLIELDGGFIDFRGDVLVADATITTAPMSLSSFASFAPGVTITALNGALVRLRQPLNFSNGMTFEVFSDSDLEIGSLSIGSLIGNAAMLVDGEGTRVVLSQQSNATLSIGHTLGGPALLEITNSAEFVTGTGGVLVSRTGTLNIAAGTFDANSEILVDGGHLTHTSGNLLQNPGEPLTVVNGGEASFAGNFVLPPFRVFDVDDEGTVNVGGDLHAEGTIHVRSTSGMPDDPGGTLDVAGELTIDGEAVNLSQGTVSADTITLNSGAFNFNGGTLHVGVFNGNLVNQGGTLAPGQSAGGTTILGDYTQQSGATLQIEIGGLATATEYDFVNVTGTTLLGGELELDVINGYLPSPTDEFIVFNAASLLSFFNNVGNGQRLDTVDGLGSFLVHYGPTSAFDLNQIVLTDFEFAALPGDYNQNGIVDAADYTVWRDRLGSGTSLPNDDTAGVGPDDYDRWVTHFGETLGSGSLAAIPEPTALAQSIVVAIICGTIRSRKKKSLGGGFHPGS